MIDYETYEPQIIALLAPLQAQGVQVRGMPNQPQRQGTDTPGGARVVMGWFGTSGGYSNRIVLEIFSPTLNGATGIYQLPRQIERLLHRQRIAGLGMLEFGGWELAERSELKAAYYRAVMGFTVQSMGVGG